MSFYKIRPRGGTASQWTSANPILAEREIGYEFPTGGLGTGRTKMKMGDGVTHWNDLPYASVSPIVENQRSTSQENVPSSAYVNGKLDELTNKRRNNIVIGATSTEKALSTNFAIVPMTDYTVIGSKFEMANDGGFRVLQAGTVLISAFCAIQNVNSGDNVLMSIGGYKNGSWTHTSFSHVTSGAGSYRSGTIANYAFTVSDNEIIYLRAANGAAQRGTVAGARLTIELI